MMFNEKLNLTFFIDNYQIKKLFANRNSLWDRNAANINYMSYPNSKQTSPLCHLLSDRF